MLLLLDFSFLKKKTGSGIELSPRCRAMPRAQARFLNLADQYGAPKTSFDSIWGNFGMSMVSKDVAENER